MLIQQASKLLSSLSAIPMVFFSNISTAGDSSLLTQSAQAAGTGSIWWLIAVFSVWVFGIGIVVWAMTKDSLNIKFSGDALLRYYEYKNNYEDKNTYS